MSIRTHSGFNDALTSTSKYVGQRFQQELRFGRFEKDGQTIGTITQEGKQE
jgi:hypothetical protein